VVEPSEDGVFVGSAPERISPRWVGGLTVAYDSVREAPPQVVVGKPGIWALHDRHRETVTLLDETAGVIRQTPFAADPEHFYRDVTTMRLDPLQYVTVGNDFVAVRDPHGEVARLRTHPWGAHCRSWVAFDDEESLLWLAVPDAQEEVAEASAPSARSAQYGRPAHLVVWDWQREALVQDVQLCADHAAGYVVRKHPTSGTFYVDAYLKRGDQRAWIFGRRGTTLSGSEIEGPRPMEAFAPDGTELVVQSGETREIEIGDRHFAEASTQMRLVSWPGLRTRAQIDDESLFHKGVQHEDGLSGPVYFLSDDDIVIETVRGRHLLVDRRSMTARGVLVLEGRPLADEGVVVTGLERLGDNRFVSYGAGRYDVWVLGDS